MAKGPTVDESLARLSSLKGQPDSVETRAALAQGLANRSNLVAAKAASLVEAIGIREMTGELSRAFDRFMSGADKGCAAKAAIASALNAAGAAAEAVFLRGIRHVQREPAWGGTVDVAAELRATCALGLA